VILLSAGQPCRHGGKLLGRVGVIKGFPVMVEINDAGIKAGIPVLQPSAIMSDGRLLFIDETNAYADYLVTDRVTDEGWGLSRRLGLSGNANMAWDGGAMAKAADDDMRLTGVERIAPTLQAHLKPEEWRRAAYVLCRGGRSGEAPARDAGPVTHWDRPATLGNETVGSQRHSLSGESFTGCPTFYPLRFADGSRVERYYPVDHWPLRCGVMALNAARWPSSMASDTVNWGPERIPSTGRRGPDTRP